MRETMSPLQVRALELMRSVLGETYLTLEVVEYELRERLADGQCMLSCTLIENPGAVQFTIEGRGVGLLDSFFNGLCGRYEPDHPSLQSIKFSSFLARGLMTDSSVVRATDAKAEARIGVLNSAGTEFEFSAVSSSVSRSSLEAVLTAVEYFVNSERAYVRIYKALEHHRKEGRPDQVGRYTEMLAEMVRNTSYSSAVERLKHQRS